MAKSGANSRVTIDISHRTIIFAAILFISLQFLSQIRGIILQIFIAVILMTALNPLVDTLHKLKVPRGISIAISYILVFGFFGYVVAGVIPPLAEQTSSFIAKLPSILSQAGLTNFAGTNLVEQITNLGSLPRDVLRISVAVLNNIFAVVTVLVISFYLLLAREKLDDYIAAIFGDANKQKAQRFIDKLEERLGGWVRGQIILMTIIGVMSYIGLTLVGIPYALPLALLAGVLEIIPTIGPIVSAVPAALVGLAISPLTATAVVALYFLIQSVENHVLVPKVMEKSVGINPLITIIIIMIGLRLGGVVGAFLGVPIFLVFLVVLNQFWSKKKWEVDK